MSLEGNPNLVNHHIDLPTAHPMMMFDDWMKEAIRINVSEPYGMVLSTANTSIPSSRVLLLKNWSEKGVVFCTSSISRKGRELSANPYASACFWWRETNQQILLNGKVEILPDTTADEYFLERPPSAKAITKLSAQSNVMKDEKQLKNRIALIEGAEILRPDNWLAYLLIPIEIEFWVGSKDRFHKRLQYLYNTDMQTWQYNYLQP